MASDNATSILYRALGATLNTQVKYLTSCAVKIKSVSIRSLLAVTTKLFLLLDLELNSVTHSFQLDWLISINEDSDNSYGLCINLNQSCSMPSIYVCFPDRNKFISIIACYYAAFQAYENGIIKSLEIKKCPSLDHQFIRSSTTVVVAHKKPLNDDKSTYTTKNYGNYAFYISVNQKKQSLCKRKSLFLSDLESEKHILAQGHYLMKLEKEESAIKESVLISQLQGDCENLKLLTLSKALSLCRGELKAHRILVLKDTYYYKKGDPAEWEGWQVEVGILDPPLRKIIYTVLRRKFIPPYFENYSDISIIGIFTLDKLALFGTSAIVSFFNIEEKEIAKNIELVLDSIYYTGPIDYIDQLSVLNLKIDSLSLDSASLYFFYNQLKLYKSQAFENGYHLIISVIRILCQPSVLQTLSRSGNVKIKKKALSLGSLEKRIIQRLGSCEEITQISKQDLRESIMANYNKFVNGFVDTYYRISQDQSKETQLVKVLLGTWEEKISRFFFFCLDGNLTNGILDFELIFEALKDTNELSFGPLKVLIAKLLYPQLLIENIKLEMNPMPEKLNSEMLYRLVKYYDLSKLFVADTLLALGNSIALFVKKHMSHSFLEAMDFYITNYISENYMLTEMTPDDEVKAYSKIEQHFSVYQEMRTCLLSCLVGESDIRSQVLASSIIINLCNFDSSMSTISFLLSNGIIDSITTKFNSPCSSLSEASITLLYLISEKISILKFSSQFANVELFKEINYCLINYSLRGNFKALHNKTIKAIYNIVASDYTFFQNFALSYQTELDNDCTISINDNIAYSVIQMMLQPLSGNLEDIISLFNTDSSICDLLCLIIKKNNRIKNLLLKDMQIFGLLDKKIEEMTKCYVQITEKFRRKTINEELRQYLFAFITFLAKFFKFVYSLFDYNRQAFMSVRSALEARFIKLFTVCINNKDSSEIKKVFPLESKSELNEYLSALFSLDRLIYPEDEESDVNQKILPN